MNSNVTKIVLAAVVLALWGYIFKSFYDSLSSNQNVIVAQYENETKLQEEEFSYELKSLDKDPFKSKTYRRNNSNNNYINAAVTNAKSSPTPTANKKEESHKKNLKTVKKKLVYKGHIENKPDYLKKAMISVDGKMLILGKFEKTEQLKNAFISSIYNDSLIITHNQKQIVLIKGKELIISE